MKNWRRNLIVLCFLYLITWIGGYFFSQHKFSDYVDGIYEKGQRMDQFNSEHSLRIGEPKFAREGGPIKEMKWCLPVLPAVLVTYSHFIVGPTLEREGISVYVVPFFYWHSFHHGA